MGGENTGCFNKKTKYGRAIYCIQGDSRGLFKYYGTNAPAYFITAETNWVCQITITFANRCTDHSEVTLLC